MKIQEPSQFEAIHHASKRIRSLTTLLTIAVSGLLAPPVDAVPISASGPPVLTGSGASTTARWSNVGVVDGQDIDLFMEIISHTGQDTYAITTVNDDFKFQFTDGEDGDVRSATLRWSFYESGTSNPVVMPDLGITVDDLDDDKRHESLSTADAYDYTVNNPSTLAHSMIGGVVSAAGAGGIEYNSGDPQAAVKLLFSNKSSIVITYQTEFDGTNLSAYHHDGDGDFAFDDPPRQLYYTFNLTNNELDAEPVSFFDSLPAGIIWDSEYAVVTGSISGGSLEFSNGNRDVSASNLVLGSGVSTLKLRTLETSQSGIIYNEATVDPNHPEAETLTASATITLP